MALPVPVLRDYQDETVIKTVRYLKGGGTGGLVILPTGSGKSLVIAAIIKELNAKVLVLQPSKEILTQNFAKYRAYGFYASVFSASLGRKEISKVVFATIGSIHKRTSLFQDFPYILIDECHLCSAKEGMFANFLAAMAHAKLCGLTASPYRLSTDGFGGSILKFLTRTRPRLFFNVVHFVQNKVLFDRGYLCKVVYYEMGGFDRSKIKKNTTGADFDEKSLRLYYDKVNLAGLLVKAVTRLAQIRRNVLVFVRYIKEAAWLASQIEGAEYITGEMSAEKRDDILRRFKVNKLKILINCGVVAIGFDKPDLETVVLGKETMSLAAYYQWVGRGIRIDPDKSECWVVDLCGNIKTFGKVENLHISNQGGGKWIVSDSESGRQLTNEYFGEKPNIPQKI